MQTQLQRVEIEAARRGDDDFAIDDAPGWQGGETRGVQLGELAI